MDQCAELCTVLICFVNLVGLWLVPTLSLRISRCHLSFQMELSCCDVCTTRATHKNTRERLQLPSKIFAVTGCFGRSFWQYCIAKFHRFHSFCSKWVQSESEISAQLPDHNSGFSIPLASTKVTSTKFANEQKYFRKETPILGKELGYHSVKPLASFL